MELIDTVGTIVACEGENDVFAFATIMPSKLLKVVAFALSLFWILLIACISCRILNFFKTFSSTSSAKVTRYREMFEKYFSDYRMIKENARLGFLSMVAFRMRHWSWFLKFITICCWTMSGRLIKN